MSQEEIIQQICSEAMDELKKDENFANEKFNEIEKQKFGIMKNVWLFMLNKLLGKLKVQVTIYWNEKEVFNYVIPKN